MRATSTAVIIGASILGQAAFAAHVELEEILVMGKKDLRVFKLDETVEIVPDTAALMRKVPGGNINANGPLSGIVQYRGMYGSRVSTQVDGTVIRSAGPNAMDAPLSYAPAAQLESLEVYRGIAPVSAGQETIGGAVNANTWNGDFSDGEGELSGRFHTGWRSVNDGKVVNAAMTAANRNHRLKLAALSEWGNDAEFDDGKVRPTEYERQRYDVGYGYRRGAHTLQFNYGRSETGDAGTPALPMDIQYFDGDLASLHYDFAGNDYEVKAKLYYSDIVHGMSNFHLRPAPTMPGMWRRNVAKGENLGFSITARRGGWKAGLDGHAENHDSNIDNPNNAMFFVVNFNDAERRVLGVFAERQQAFGDGWLAELGLRYNNVSMDADRVDGTPAAMSMMGMAPGRVLRDNFNGADRSQTDDNVDWVAKIYYHPGAGLRYYLGGSRKTRSPSYQERYLWVPMQSTGGLADGRTYTGNIGLDPEVAHEVEIGLDWNRGSFSFVPRVFYRDVSDYIQGTASTSATAVMFVQMMNMMNGTSNAVPLEFNNVDAVLYGFDIDWGYQFNDHWSLNGIVNYARGERDDSSDDLYRIAPLNTLVALNYRAAAWGVTLETLLYDEQNKVSRTNTEQKSAGYALLNVRGFWEINSRVKLGLSADNLTDKKYRDHLAGVNRVSRNPDIALGERLPGYGRSISLRFDYQF